MQNKGWDYIIRLRPQISALCLLLFLMLGKPQNMFFIAIGTMLAGLGMLIRSWAAGCIEKNKTLCKAGIYGLMRHPLYGGNFLFGLGLLTSVIDPASSWTYLFFFAFFLLFFLFYRVVLAEEAFLAQQFPEQFALYKQTVPRFLPKYNPNYKLNYFSFKLFLTNQEYWRVVFYLLVFSWLLVRYYLKL